MKSIAKLAILALAFYTNAADAQINPIKARTATATAAPVKVHYVVQLWHASEQPTAQEQDDLNKIRTTYKGKKVEVYSIRWSTQPELLAMLHKFFEDVQADPADENSFKVNGSPLELTKKSTLLIADDHLVLNTPAGKPVQNITDYLKGAIK
jgi:hypothetical protein